MPGPQGPIGPAGPQGPGAGPKPVGNFVAAVFMMNGQPYSDVEVWLFEKGSGLSAMQRTDATGLARFYALPVGGYRMEIIDCRDRCRYVSGWVEIMPNEETQQEIVATWAGDGDQPAADNSDVMAERMNEVDTWTADAKNELATEGYIITEKGHQHLEACRQDYIDGRLQTYDDWFQCMMAAFSGNSSQEGIYWNIQRKLTVRGDFAGWNSWMHRGVDDSTQMGRVSEHQMREMSSLYF